MPAPGEQAARLTDITVAEVAEALEAVWTSQRRQRIGDGLLAVFSTTADYRPVTIVLIRPDDSFVLAGTCREADERG
jgi:hypothetical protein